MDSDELLRTTFSARDFDDEPVPDDALVRILDLARFAPSGGNRQGWRVVSVDQGEIRDTLLGLVRPTMQRYFAQVAAGENPFSDVTPTAVSDADIASTEVPDDFLRSVTHAPTLLAVFVDREVLAAFDRDLPRAGITSGASIYPFVWNLLLAARAEGFGGTLTTYATPEEAPIRELLRAPERYALAALVPLGRPTKQLTKLTRHPVRSFATRGTFDGPALDTP